MADFTSSSVMEKRILEDSGRSALQTLTQEFKWKIRWKLKKLGTYPRFYINTRYKHHFVVLSGCKMPGGSIYQSDKLLTSEEIKDVHKVV